MDTGSAGPDPRELEGVERRQAVLVENQQLAEVALLLRQEFPAAGQREKLTATVGTRGSPGTDGLRLFLKKKDT